MNRILTLLLLFVVGVCTIHAVRHDRQGRLMVGAAKADITPDASLFPFLAQHEDYPYTGIHDSLYARAIVMDNGVKRAVLLELDEVSVPEGKTFCRKIAKAAGVNADDIIACVSHTHSTLHPNGQDDRLQGNIDKIIGQSIAAVKAAAARLEPARVSFARTKAYVNINNGEVVQSRGQYSNEAYSDKTLDIVRFTRTDGSLISLVLNYSTHAEVMFRSISKGGGYEITGDLPGRTAQLLEVQHKGAIVLTTTGAEGDQQPLFTSRQRTSTQGFVDQGEGGWTLVDAQARRIVDAVNEATETMPAGEDVVTLITKATEAVVPGQHRHQNRETNTIIDEPDKDVHIAVNQIYLNDIVFCGVAADIAAVIGVAVRNASGVKHTMLITNTAGSVGYVLPDEMYKNYTHAVYGSRIRPGYAQQAIINAIKQ